jgi:hypothetical protein
MFRRMSGVYRTFFGLSVCALLWTLGFVNIGRAEMTGAGTTLTAGTTEPQQVTAAYRAGRQAGRADAERDLPRNPRSNRWTAREDSRDYEDGFNRGYSDVVDSRQDTGRANDRDRPYERDRPIERDDAQASLNIGRDNVVHWQAPERVRVYVQVDNEPMKLFAEGPSGNQAAPWIEPGHLYVFVAHDPNGREVARDRLDLRRSRR